IPHATREITEQNVQRVMEMARPAQIPVDREIIHILPRGFAVDGQGGVRQPVGMSGARLDVETHVITGGSPFLKNVLKSVQQAGLQVDTIVLEPVATSEAVLTEEEKEVGVVVADIGGGTTDVAVVVDGAIAHSSVIPVGGNHVTSDLAVGLKTSRAEAERLKKEYGCALVSMVTGDELVEMSTLEGENKRPILRRALAEIIEPRMQEIYTIIRDDLKQHGFQHSLSGIVLSGGGSLLHGATELAQETLLLPARIGRPRDVDGQAESLDSPIYATAVGLLYFGAARRYREKHYANTQGPIANAWGQLRHWLLRIFGG
ncbi:MAG: cell division protein FtsA, partial [Armatimonadota bacterium]|nr:cell division protein FtsA [Armatimonadota bacterium]